MTDTSHDFRAIPIMDPERAKYHKDTLSYHAHITRDKATRARLWFWVAIVALTLAGTATGTIAMLLPLKTMVPLYLVTHEDGTVDTGISLADLGADQAQKVIRASVWRYVEERESYSYSDAKHRYDLVSLMSCDDVKRDFQQWFLRSPDSPNLDVRKKLTTISVQEISMSPVRDTPDGAVFLVRLWKKREVVGEREVKKSATATVEYVLLHEAPAAMILDDPAALCVSRYQIEENTP